MKRPDQIEYISTNKKDICLVEELWEELNKHHLMHSKNFKEHYRGMTFAKRKKDLLEKANHGTMRIDLARNNKTGEYVGYCISSITKKKEGEIESIFVESKLRHLGIGHTLMVKALAWMDEKKVVSRRVVVGNGNEDAFRFYSEFGFLPRATILTQKQKGKKHYGL
jgi:ribosomal protein S18 acetylase RimI-like enzyme